jgi:hypothetical protein
MSQIMLGAAADRLVRRSRRHLYASRLVALPVSEIAALLATVEQLLPPHRLLDLDLAVARAAGLDPALLGLVASGCESPCGARENLLRQSA